MLPVCQRPIGSIIIRSDDTDVLLLSVYCFSRRQSTDHLFICMLEILEWNVTFQDISLQTKLAHQFVDVSLLCNSFGVFSKQNKQEAYSELVTHMGMLSTLKTFHEYNLTDSVDVAHQCIALVW